MLLSNVNIGTGPSAGDGDPLRTAFNTINNNFTKIQSNVNALTNSVSSVAGRTGNVTLTTQDIIGINNYATTSYVDSKLSANIANLQANITLIQSDINTLYGNAGVQSSTLATLTSNAAAQAGSLTTLTANAASQAGELTTLLSNASVQAGEIASLLSNAGSQHEAISSLQSNAAVQAGAIATLTSNAAVQAGAIADLVANAAAQAGLIANAAGTYSNSNVASYLTTYGGNVSVGNIIFDDLSVQTTAYTGTQWRSNLISSLTSKPSWLSYYPGLKNQEGTQYGFDAGGMFFTSNSDNDFAYPIQTNLHFHETDVLEIVTTIYFGATNNDQGLCIFPADTRPIWKGGVDTSRIAFQYTSGIPVLYGQTTANTAPGSPVLTAGNYYTIKFIYNPANTITVETFSGNTATGSAIDSRTLNEVLPAGDYRIGFDADNDAAGVKSYFKTLTVRTLTNTVVNDLEIQGEVTGNLIPSANLTYSLGSITNQWKDLFVGNNTIYIGGVPLGIDAGGNLLVNGNTVQVGAGYSNSNVASYLPTYSGNIAGNIVKNGYTWTFSNTGTTTFPTGVRLSNARGPNTVNFTTDIDKSFQIETQTSTTGRLWSFGTDGNLTLPQNANINYSNGVSILTGLGSSSYSNVEVAAYLPTYTGNIAGNISKAGYAWTFGTDGTTTFPGNLVIAGNTNVFGTNGALIQPADDLPLIALSSGANGAVSSIWVEDYANIGTSNIAAVYANPTVGSKIVRIAVGQNGGPYGPNLWDFGNTGTTRFPGGTILAPAGTSITMQSDQNSQLLYQNANVAVAPDIATSTTFSVQPNFATLVVGYRDGSSNEQDNTWLWNIDGMTLPEGGTIKEGGISSGAIKLTPAGGANEYQALLIYPTAGAPEGDHIHLTAGGGSTELYLGNDFHYVKLVDGGNVEIRTDDLLGNVGTWNFDTDGNLTLPSDGYLRITSGITTTGASPAPIISGFTITNSQGISGSGNVTAGNISASGISGKIGYSSGNFAQQTTSNSTQVTSHFTSGNIQLMSIDLAAHDVHTVAFACNKLTTNDMLIVKHIAGGLTSVYVDAYVASDGLAVIWMRDITGVGTGSFSPMLKYTIIRAPGS